MGPATQRRLGVISWLQRAKPAESRRSQFVPPSRRGRFCGDTSGSAPRCQVKRQDPRRARHRRPAAAALVPFVPSFTYQLIDLSERTDAEIKAANRVRPQYCCT